MEDYEYWKGRFEDEKAAHASTEALRAQEALNFEELIHRERRATNAAGLVILLIAALLVAQEFQAQRLRAERSHGLDPVPMPSATSYCPPPHMCYVPEVCSFGDVLVYNKATRRFDCQPAEPKR